jgi:hypothetical protein
MTVVDSIDRLNRYVGVLEALCGAPATVREFPPFKPERGRVTAIIFVDTPSEGYVTGFTYGLSLTRFSTWGASGRELSITVRSTAVEWAEVPARTVAGLRGMGSFHRGQVIGYKEPYVAGSEMSSILLVDPLQPWQSDLARLDLSLSEAEPPDLVEIIGACPIHASEREYVQKNGVELFLSLEWDPFDPSRVSVVT